MKHKILIGLLLVSGVAFAQPPTGYLKQSVKSNTIAYWADSAIGVTAYSSIPYLRSGVSTRAGQYGIDSVAHRSYFYSGGLFRRQVSMLDTTLIIATKTDLVGIVGYTDEQAQDAIGAMVNSEFTYTDGTPLLAINSVAFSKITGTVPINQGGSGQTTANAALNAFLPSQGSNAGKLLTTDASNTSWSANLTWVSPLMQLGANSASSTATPMTISLGGTFSNTAGDPSKSKLKLYEDGGANNTHGFSVSGSAFEFHSSTSSAYKFYNASVLKVTFNSDGSAVFVGDVTVPDEAYDATNWNGSLEVPTKNALRDYLVTLGGGYTDEAAQDAIGAMIDGSLIYVDGTPLLTRAALTGDVTATQGSNATTIADNSVDGTDIALGSDATGDIMYYDGTNYIRLAAGTNTHVLTLAGGVPTWAAGSGGLTGFTTFGSTPNANGGSVSGANIILQPANASNPGGISTGAQDIPGDKTFLGKFAVFANPLGVDMAASKSGLNMYYNTTSTTSPVSFFLGTSAAFSKSVRFEAYPASYSTAGMQAADHGAFFSVGMPLNVGAYTSHTLRLWTDNTLRVEISSAGVTTFSYDAIVPDEAYDATGWNGNLEIPTKNAIRDKIESLAGVSDGDKGDIVVSSSGTVWTVDDNSVDGTDIAVGSDAQGDVMYYDGTNWVRLGAGTSGHFLKTQGTGANPVWAAGSSAENYYINPVIGPTGFYQLARERNDSTLDIKSLKIAVNGVTITPTTTDTTVYFNIPNVYSGTYTPTLDDEVNCTAFVVGTTFNYMRVGDVVTVSGRIDINPTTTATLTTFTISLPIASDFSGGGVSVPERVRQLKELPKFCLLGQMTRHSLLLLHLRPRT